ncbi:MAG: serine protease [Rickettsiales bacterium]|jgi:hypothetical protein|nr:serine protease [Rickettsiales bacterium]
MPANFTGLGNLWRKVRDRLLRGNFWPKARYFMGNFWPYMVGVMAVAITVRLRMIYSRSFHSDEITKFVKNSRHAGNAIFINKGFLITSYRSIATACRVTKTTENVRTFIIFNGEAIKVDIVAEDESSGLTLLRIDPTEKHYVVVNNFALFPNVSGSDYRYLGSEVFISKMINDPDSDFYRKYKVAKVEVDGYSVRSRDVLRKNFGEVVLNERLELLGLTDGNSSSSKIKFLGNEIRILEQGRIKNFLKKNNVRYYKNIKNMDLRDFPRYRGDINAELVCYIKEAQPQRIIRRYR